MGWQTEGRGEGFVVALVQDRDPRAGHHWPRELRGRPAFEPVATHVQAACECGWRSPYQRPLSVLHGKVHYDGVVWGLTQRERDRLADLWMGHECPKTGPGR